MTDNEYMDHRAYVWVDAGLGRYAGEAPYTLAVPPSVTGPGDAGKRHGRHEAFPRQRRQRDHGRVCRPLGAKETLTVTGVTDSTRAPNEMPAAKTQAVAPDWPSNRAKPEVFEMPTLPHTQPHHIIVSWAEKRLAFYFDGKKVKEIDPSPAHLLMPTLPMHFAIPWRGTFEYVATYNRFIEEPEEAKNAVAVAAELAQRKTLPRIEVQARWVVKWKVPDPGQMAPYRSALIVNEYEVEKVLQGDYAGKTIRVAQWGMLDLQPTPLARQAPGASVNLVLENFTDHDELAPELISDRLEENFDLVLYTDVNL